MLGDTLPLSARLRLLESLEAWIIRDVRGKCSLWRASVPGEKKYSERLGRLLDSLIDIARGEGGGTFFSMASELKPCPGLWKRTLLQMECCKRDAEAAIARERRKPGRTGLYIGAPFSATRNIQRERAAAQGAAQRSEMLLIRLVQAMASAMKDKMMERCIEII